MDPLEIETLRGWLERRGITLSVADALTAADAAVEGQASLTWPDGRRLVFAPATDYRTLAEHAGDLVLAVDADLVLRWASPDTEAMLGWAPGELAGRTLAELLVVEECAAFIARHFVAAGGQGDVPDLFRLRCRDGSTRWMEARVSGLPPGSGLGRYVVNLRDASRRKQAEEALAAANQALAALATTDALTGLANRREFDTRLRREWFRALRDQRPLALLMIDIDHFKSLNDRYGHPTGDLFLTAVARQIDAVVHRASDLAARYGGEEFAVLLPGTSAHGAGEIAERLREAVAAQRFDAVVPGGQALSVSIGVAAGVPAADDSLAALVDAADAALYRAKREGRNRVACAA